MKFFSSIDEIVSTLNSIGYSVERSPNACALLKDERPFLISIDPRDESYVRVAFLCVDALERGARLVEQLRAAMLATGKVKGVKALIKGDFLHFAVEAFFLKFDEAAFFERAFERCAYAEKIYREIMGYETGESTPSPSGGINELATNEQVASIVG